LLIVVTNQAGIGRGYYDEEDFINLTEWMCKRFDEAGAPISDVFFCPFHPIHGIGKYRKDSYDRKPNPGMFLRAAGKYQISMPDSIMLGDKPSDMEAAKRAGIGLTVYYNPIHKKDEIQFADFQIQRFNELLPILETKKTE
jgi:D-glycero-D-manno-heptose 1,7-bisphosphate phosphatase